MAAVDDRAQVGRLHLGVALGRLEALVSQEPLDVADVGAPLEEMRRAGVTQQVGGELEVDAQAEGVHAVAEGVAVEAPAFAAEEQGALVDVPHELRPRALQVVEQRLLRLPAERDDAVLAPLGFADEDLALVEVDVPEVELADLAPAHPRPVEQLHHRPVAQAERVLGEAADEAGDLSHLERAREVARRPRIGQVARGVHEEPPRLHEPREEEAQRGHRTDLGAERVVGALGRGLALEAQAISSEDIAREVGGAQDTVLFARPGEQIPDRAAVGLARPFREVLGGHPFLEGSKARREVLGQRRRLGAPDGARGDGASREDALVDLDPEVGGGAREECFGLAVAGAAARLEPEVLPIGGRRVLQPQPAPGQKAQEREGSLARVRRILIAAGGALLGEGFDFVDDRRFPGVACGFDAAARLKVEGRDIGKQALFDGAAAFGALAEETARARRPGGADLASRLPSADLRLEGAPVGKREASHREASALDEEEQLAGTPHIGVTGRGAELFREALAEGE
jgi:hypothetical protein